MAASLAVSRSLVCVYAIKTVTQQMPLARSRSYDDAISAMPLTVHYVHALTSSKQCRDPSARLSVSPVHA